MQLFHDISSSLVQADWSVGMTPEKIGYVSGYMARKNLPVLKQMTITVGGLSNLKRFSKFFLLANFLVNLQKSN